MESTNKDTNKTWYVLWNAKYWDYENYLQSVRDNKTVPTNLDDTVVPAGGLPFSMLPQAKGGKDYKTVPQRGDKVIFVVCGLGKGQDWLEVADGIVFDGFETGTSHQVYPFNKGLTRDHTAVEQFAWVIVTPRSKEHYTVSAVQGGQITWRVKK